KQQRDQTTGQAPSQTQPSQTQRQQTQQQPQQGQTQQRSGAQTQTQTRTQSNVNLTAQQRTHIQQTVLDRPNVPRVNSANFSLSVGTRIPRNSVRFVAVPDTLISINPAWRGHSFFVVRDEIVIVEPREETIVAVVPVGSSGAALEGRPSGGRFATGGGGGG